MSNTRRGRGPALGFTLVELMVAAAISALVVAGMVTLFVTQRAALSAMQQLNEVSQNVRTASDQVVTDLRNAGYGAPRTSISSWITWVSGITGRVTVVQGSGSNSDILHIVGALDPPCAFLAATSSANSITVNSGQVTNFNTTDRKIIYIGRTESARITAISGNTLTVSTSPTAAQDLKFRYATNTPVELVKVITYSWGDASSQYPHTQYLKRSDNITTYAAEWHKMLANSIEDFQIAGSGGRFTITITGRTRLQDARYVDPVKGDHYRRISYSMDTVVRQP